MMLVIPEIKIKDNKCVMQITGEPDSEEYYHDLSYHPDLLCKLWRKENAKTLHITDLDGLRNKFSNQNLSFFNAIAQSTDIPIQIHSNFDDINSCYQLFNSGIYRIVIDRSDLISENDLRGLISTVTPSRVVFFINDDNGRIKNNQDLSVLEYCVFLKQLGATRVVYKDSQSPISDDIEPMRKIAENTGLRVTAYNGADTPQKLWELENYFLYGIDSVILGYPLYNNHFPCQKIWRMIEAEIKD